MPWCEDCAKFWNPTSVGTDGRCPTCGRPLERPEKPVQTEEKAPSLRELANEQRTPWHFKLLVTAAALYLAWRVIDLVR